MLFWKHMELEFRMTFEEWKEEVDVLCANFFYGVVTDQLPDYLWHDAYARAESPEEAFDDYLEEEYYAKLCHPFKRYAAKLSRSSSS